MRKILEKLNEKKTKYSEEFLTGAGDTRIIVYHPRIKYGGNIGPKIDFVSEGEMDIGDAKSFLEALYRAIAYAESIKMLEPNNG